MNRRRLNAASWVAASLLISCGPPPSESEQAAVSESTDDRSELVQPQNWWDNLPRPIYAHLERVGIYQNWFEVYKLPDGTYAIYEPYQFEEAISYLVVGSESGVLIDNGTGIGNIRQVVAELTDLPVWTALTHEHYDHVGGSHLFEEVALYDHPQAIARLKAGVPHERALRYVVGDYIWKPLPKGVDPDTFSIRPASPTRLLKDGEVIDLGGRKLEVLYTPGHSPGSVCYLDRENRVLFTGDHFFPGPLYAHAEDVNLDHYVASNQKLVSLLDAYDHVLSGHNDPWVKSDVIPRVSEAFETIFSGQGDFSEDRGLRRYRFDGFDVLIHTATVEERMSAAAGGQGES